MKKSIFLLGLLTMAGVCLTACGSKNYEMSFEEAVDSIAHSELSNMINNTKIYEQSFDISSNFFMSEDNVDANLNFSMNSKQNREDSEGETNLSIKVNASGNGGEGKESIMLDGNAAIKYLSNAIYFKLNSLNVDGSESLNPNSLGFNVDGIRDQWFSFELTEEMLNKIKDNLPEDFDRSEVNDENDLQEFEENLQKFKDNIKGAIINEGSLVYNGMYSEFNGYNARKFSIDKEKMFNATTKYIETLVPEEYMDDYMEALEEINIDEIFENIPLKNFEGYLVITGDKKVQVVVENLDIEDDFSSVKINGTLGRDRYELVAKEDGENIFILSAKLNKSHYDVVMNVTDLEILKGTITPEISEGKISIDFDLSINFELGEKINIPLKGGWRWKEISKFNVDRPTNSKNLLEDIMENVDLEDLDPAIYQSIAGGMEGSVLTAPIVAGGVIAAAFMPRMQSAQSRARDVARKSDLSQIQTAIIVSQADNGKWPGVESGAIKGVTIGTIEKEIKEAGFSSVPVDPIQYNPNYGLGRNYIRNIAEGEYLYLVAKKNGVENGGFILMAKTEEEGSSNWVVCKDKTGLENGYITNNSDIESLTPCYYLSKGESCSIKECTYTDEDELRYILTY